MSVIFSVSVVSVGWLNSDKWALGYYFLESLNWYIWTEMLFLLLFCLFCFVCFWSRERFIAGPQKQMRWLMTRKASSSLKGFSKAFLKGRWGTGHRIHNQFVQNSCLLFIYLFIFPAYSLKWMQMFELLVAELLSFKGVSGIFFSEEWFQ